MLKVSVHIAVIATPYSNEPCLLYFRICLCFLGCVYKHLQHYLIHSDLVRPNLMPGIHLDH
jgi:hypothetical protein